MVTTKDEILTITFQVSSEIEDMPSIDIELAKNLDAKKFMQILIGVITEHLGKESGVIDWTVYD